MYFLYFIISLFEKSVALNLNKFESPSLKDALCQVWLKFIMRVTRSYYQPLEKGVTILLNNLHPKMLSVKFNEIGDENENVKRLQTDGQTDGS